jgi:hypothetical protein
MWVGEEVMVTLRELSPGGVFKWHKALEAYAAIYGHHYWGNASSRKSSDPIFAYLKEKRYLHMSLGNLLRGQLKGGTLRRISKGLYAFTSKGLYALTSKRTVSYPLFCTPGSYSGRYSHGRSDDDYIVRGNVNGFHSF